MTTFTKNFIGKGKQVKGLNIVTVAINMDEAEAHIFEYEGTRYLRFDVAALKQADQYGKTHTAYVSVREVKEETKPAAKKRSPKKEKA